MRRKVKEHRSRLVVQFSGAGLMSERHKGMDLEKSKLCERKPPKDNGGVAQMGERLLCTQEARGSNPLISTRDPPVGKPMRRKRNGLIAQVVRAHA